MSQKIILFFLLFGLNFGALNAQNLIRDGGFEQKLSDTLFSSYLLNDCVADWYCIYLAGAMYFNSESYHPYSTYKIFKPFRGKGLVKFWNQGLEVDRDSIPYHVGVDSCRYIDTATQESVGCCFYNDYGIFQPLSAPMQKDSVYRISYRIQMGLDTDGYRNSLSGMEVLFTVKNIVPAVNVFGLPGFIDHEFSDSIYPPTLYDSVLDTSYRWRLVEYTFKADSNYAFIYFSRFHRYWEKPLYIDLATSISPTPSHHKGQTLFRAWFETQFDDIRLLPLHQYLQVSKDTAVCEGKTLVLRVLSGDGGYRWIDNRFPNVILSTSDTLKITAGDSDAVYSVMSPYDTASVAVYIKNYGIDSVLPTQNKYLCRGGSVSVHNDMIDHWQDKKTDTLRIFNTAGNYTYTTRYAKCISYIQNIQIQLDTFGKFNLPKDTLLDHCERFYTILPQITTSKPYRIQWLDSTVGNTYTAKQSGLYTAKVWDSFCSFADSMHVVFKNPPISPKIKLENGTDYTALQDSVLYQWYTCSPWRRIANQHQRTFHTATLGSYAVVLTTLDGRCSDTSDCVALYSNGIQSLAEEELQIFPNPTTDELNIIFDKPQTSLHLALYNAEGKCVLDTDKINIQKMVISLAPFPVGNYLLRIERNGQIINRKIQKYER